MNTTPHSFIKVAHVSLALGLTFTALSCQASEPVVIELTQTACQFLESENGLDHGYRSAKAEDCDVINASSGNERVGKAKVLNLKPGKYVFRVANKNVPYELGFWLRGASLLKRAVLPSVSGGGLTQGKVQDYAIELKAGDYVYSCPLNPTPDYKLVVQ